MSEYYLGEREQQQAEWAFRVETSNSYTMKNWKTRIIIRTPKIIHPKDTPKGFNQLKEDMKFIREHFPIKDGWEVLSPMCLSTIKAYKEGDPPEYNNLIYYGLEIKEGLEK